MSKEEFRERQITKSVARQLATPEQIRKATKAIREFKEKYSPERISERMKKRERGNA